jgi:hypothetical protein
MFKLNCQFSLSMREIAEAIRLASNVKRFLPAPGTGGAGR